MFKPATTALNDKNPEEVALLPLNERHVWRVSFLEKCEYDEAFRLEAIAKSAESYEYFFDHFLMTFDPREDSKDNPFVLYPYQRDFLRWLHERVQNKENGILEKSRDMGATWLVLGYVIWGFIFIPGFTCLIGSQKERKTDNRDIDSLFGRLEYLLRNLPHWMLPKDFEFNKHRQYLKIFNPENGNSLIGDSANPDFARQGRYTMVILDEFAFWEYADLAWRSVTGGSTPTAIALSTPNGSNKFKHLRFESGLPVYTMHWSLHPARQQEWYERAKVGKTAEDVAQELDISYSKSVMGRVYPEWDNVEWVDKLTWEVEFGSIYNPNLPLFVSWDYGKSDSTAIIWFQKDMGMGKVYIIDAYHNHGRTIDFYVPFITGEIDSEIAKRYTFTQDELEIIETHKNWTRGTHFGDPSGHQTHVESDRSALQILASYGIYVNTNPQAQNFAARRTKTKLLIPRLTIRKNPRTQFLNDCMMEARYPERRLSEMEAFAGRVPSQSTTPTILPIHDWTSHFRSALEYFAVNEPVRRTEGKVSRPPAFLRMLKR